MQNILFPKFTFSLVQIELSSFCSVSIIFTVHLTALFNCPLLEKPTFLQPVKKFIVFYGHRRFITVIKLRPLSLS
jgi:hypothetical protein